MLLKYNKLKMKGCTKNEKNVSIVWYGVSSYKSSSPVLDNVSIAPAPTCAAAENLAATDIYQNDATLTWTLAQGKGAAAEEFARVEGILPAPESAHAIKVALDEAKKCKETGEEKTIVFGLTGTGYFDMMSYEKFHNGVLQDYRPTDEEIAKGLERLPKV